MFLGLDDTDTLDSPGTNQLARRLVAALPAGFRGGLILRHQLLFDSRIPYTSHNGSASITIQAEPGADPAGLLAVVRREIRDWYVPGSDPGLCLAESVPPVVMDFGLRCQREPVTQAEARRIARGAGVVLEGFGGTEDGVIGALAAVGLRAAEQDGRVIHAPGWSWPDAFAGVQPVDAIVAHGVDEIRVLEGDTAIRRGAVDIGKHLRPSFRAGKVVLFVERVMSAGPVAAEWRAIKLD